MDTEKNASRSSHIWFHGDTESMMKLSMIKMAVAGFMLLSGIFAWMYVFVVHDKVCRSLMIPMLATNGIVLVLNFLSIAWVGYEDRFQWHLTVTYCATIVISVIALYLCGTRLLTPPETAGAAGMFAILQFIVYVFLSSVMAVVPSLLDCGLMWGIMRIFGKEKRTAGPDKEGRE